MFVDTKEVLKQTVYKLSEDNTRTVLKFLLYLLDEEGLTSEDLSAIKKCEE